MASDIRILGLLAEGRLVVDAESGRVYASRSNTPRKPTGARTKKGYLRLCVRGRSGQEHFMVHRVVWVAVYGPVPVGHEVDHRNGIKDDNRIANLEAVTGGENMRRAREAGRFANCGLANRTAPRDSMGRFLPRVGKKAAGRALDGRTWDEYPA